MIPRRTSDAVAGSGMAVALNWTLSIRAELMPLVEPLMVIRMKTVSVLVPEPVEGQTPTSSFKIYRQSGLGPFIFALPPPLPAFMASCFTYSVVSVFSVVKCLV